MRPLPTSPTKTFQSPKVATSDGLDGFLLRARFGRGLGGLGRGDGGRKKGARGANRRGGKPNGAKGRKDKTRHHKQSFEPGLGLVGQTRGGASLPFDPGKIPAFRLAGRRTGCNPAFGY